MARINEIGDTEKGQYMLGRLMARKHKKEGFKKGNEIGKYAEKAKKHALPDKQSNLTDAHANGWRD